MKFYSKNGEAFEASNTSELFANIFLIRAKKFKNELNALLDKYGFSFEGYIDSNINDDSDITASLYIKETEITESKRHKIEIMKIETMNFQKGNEIEYPELKVNSVVQESY